MSKDSKRQAWTKFVEEREREAKRPRGVRKRAQAELEAGLDDLVTESVLKTSGRTDAKR